MKTVDSLRPRIAAGLMVRDLMTAPALALREDDTVAALYDLMDTHHVRHVPVVDDEGDLVGLVSHRDLLRFALVGQADVPLSMERQLLAQRHLDEIATRDVVTAEADQEIGEAVDLMLENKFGCLPVVEGNRLVGILTEADFVRFVGRKMTK
jgi:CBS domain-containing membrane protein